MVDNAGDNGGAKSCTLPYSQADKELGGIKDDGVDARPLLEEGAGSSQHQLGPVLTRQYGLPRVLNL